MGRRLWFLAAVVLAWSPRGGLASDFSKFLRELVKDQHNREPKGTELNHYSNVSRDRGPLEAYLQMLASDEVYVRQLQRNTEAYVNKLYQTFLQRPPREDEMRFWFNQFQVNGPQQRLEMLRTFCQSNNIRDVPGYTTPNPPRYPYGGNDWQAANSLVDKVLLFINLADRELGGSRFGNDIDRSARALLAASQQYQRLSPSASAGQRQTAAGNVRRSVDQLESLMRSVPGASSQCQSVLWDISQLVSTLPGSGGAGFSRPDAPASSFPPQLSGDVNLLADQLQQFLQALAPMQFQSTYHANLFRDVNGLAVQVQSLQYLLEGGDRTQVTQVMGSIRTHGREIGRQVADGEMGMQQSWWNIAHQLDLIAGQLGLQGDIFVTPGHTVIINRPAWNQFPGQISPGYQASGTNQAVVATADQLINLMDDYIQSLRRIHGASPQVKQMVTQSINLKNATLVARQQAANGVFGTGLMYAAREPLQIYRQDASQAFLTMVGVNPALNSPVWSQIGQLADQLYQQAGQ